MSCISRRDFLKLLGYSALFTTLPSFPSVAGGSGLNPMDWVNLINLSCINCKVNLTGCIKIKKGKIKVAPKIKYWMPVAFIESTKALEIGRTLPLGFVQNLINPFVNQLAPFIPKGSYGIHSIGTDSHTYMKLYPHYFGFPNVLSAKIRALIVTLANPHPVCVACNFADAIKSALVPQMKVFEELQERFEPIAEKIEQGQEFRKYLNGLENIYGSIQAEIPFLPSELFFFTWAIPEFSIDNKTIAPVLRGIMQAIQTQNAPLSVLMCPHLSQYAGKYIKLPQGIDLSFLCVGYWGYGYPRTGVVRHDDPRIASLLSIARFHHLFTKTISLIRPKFEYSRIKYQLYYPEKSDCFRIGYYSDDPTVKQIQQMAEKTEDILSSFENLDLSAVSDIDLKEKLTALKEKIKQDFKESKENFGKDIKNFNPKSIAGTIKGFNLHKPRATGVVVWKYYSKCCW